MWILLIIIPVLLFLALEAFFSGSETAIISTNKMRLRAMADRGNRRADLVIQLLKRPERLLGTTLVGTNMALAASTTLASRMVAAFLASSSEAGANDLVNMVTTAVMTPIILIFGEIIPKSICRAKANSIALSISPALRWAAIVFNPIVTFITKISNSFALLLSRSGYRPSTATEELKLLARLSEKEGLLRPHQRKMIHSIFDLQQQTVSSAMVPLVDVVSFDRNTGLEEFFRRTTETGFSRFPVYEDRVDNIVGIVNVLDVLYSMDHTEDIRSFIREDIIYFPESKHISSSLQDLQQSRYPMAIVVDEYGGVIGIVTIEDLVEEIVGEIRDERDKIRDAFNESTLECDGRMEIDEINERLGTDIPKDGYETIAGFVVSQMDRIPEVGDETSWKDLRIIVIEADKRSVSRVKFIIQ